jgi:asparagine N-glycosylation enzyme membrane subunit Stt3
MDLLTIIAVLMLVLWLLGMISSYTLGGFIHILLVIAVVALLVRIISGRRIL